MSEAFIGEIRIFAGTFAIRSWAFCDGQLLAISQNSALFSLLGTIYGGDGRTTFGLPDMRGRIPIHYGSGPGLTPRTLGSKSGTETHTLTTNELPSHTHEFKASLSPANENIPTSTTSLGTTSGYDLYVPANNLVNMASTNVTSTGGSTSHTNLMPTLCVNFIIALFGTYPSRN
jgi:microcystin-dependent protein